MTDSIFTVDNDSPNGFQETSDAEQARLEMDNAFAEYSDTPHFAKPKTDKTKKRKTKLGKSLAEMYGSLGAGVYMFDQVCGQTILENAEPMADSLEQLANENATVKRALDKLCEGTAITAVLMAHAPLVMCIAQHHAPQVRSMFKGEE